MSLRPGLGPEALTKFLASTFVQLKVSGENRLHLLSYRSIYICDLLMLEVFFSQMHTFNLQSQIDQLVNTVPKTFCLTFNVTSLDVVFPELNILNL